MTEDFLNALCDDYIARIDGLKLHDGDPGDDGEDNEITSVETITWDTPAYGRVIGTVTLTGLTGNSTHVSLWDGATFCDTREFVVEFPSIGDLIVTVVHTPKAAA